MYALHALDTGRFRLDGGAMFGVVPKTLWEKRLAPDARNRIPMAMRSLLAVDGDRAVLIDAGLGHKYDARFAELYAVDHETATLERSLAAVGLAPEDVTDVVLTHLHFDHVGGCTRRTAGGGLALAFPKARHHVQRAHWDWAMDPNPRERASFFDDNLRPLAESGQLVFHDAPAPETPHPLLPGVQALAVYGHTEAQMAVLVDGGDAHGQVLFAADLVPTQHHLAPAWTMGYDVRPLVSMAERGRVLDAAERAGWRLFFEHDPEAETASLVRTERGVAAAAPRPLADGR